MGGGNKRKEAECREPGEHNGGCGLVSIVLGQSKS